MKSFVANVCVTLGVDGEGEIAKVDEYYTSSLDEGTGDVGVYTLASAMEDSS